MQVTNEYGLPQVIVDAVTNDPYDPGIRGEKYISCTQLCNPPQLTKLWWKHQDEVTEDASERIWSLLGQAVHSVIERAAGDNQQFISEQRFYVEIDGWTIGGQVDLYDKVERHITDMKVTSVWSAMGDIKLSWRRQLNLLAYLMRHNGHPVDSVEIVAFLKDWSRMKAAYDKDYPRHAVQKIPAQLFEDEPIETFIRAQLRELENESPRDCLDDERWKRGGNWAILRGDEVKWAVVKEGQKRAVKVYDDEAAACNHAESSPELSVERREPPAKPGKRRAVKLFEKLLDAEAYIEEHKDENFYLEAREAIWQRCQSYCPVRHHCRQAASDGVVFT